MTDIEEYNKRFNPREVSNLLFRTKFSEKDEIKVKLFIKELIEILNKKVMNDMSKQDWKEIISKLKKEYHIAPSTVSLNYYYRQLVCMNEIKYNLIFEKFNVGKICRTNSGITQITVVSSPFPNGKEFSCEHDCYYCPNEPAHEGNNFQAQPRSYLFNEPGVRRANAKNFDAALQMWDRMSTLLLLGHDIDKIEAMVLGGTWGSYPEDYREEFIRDMYYAANTFYDNNNTRRERYSLEKEISINSTSYAKIIGLTLETRPDHVTYKECILFRKYNCTRVQIGVQHTDKKILSKINRGCYLEDTIRAIYNLLNISIKVDVHWMFDLPYATPEDDIKMMKYVLKNPDIRFDQAKLYPFASVPWTKTKEWEDKGIDLHYSQEQLNEVIIETKIRMPPYVRLNRVIRDIPSDYIDGGNEKTNLRQDIHKIMADRGLECKCIRCREVKNKPEAIRLMTDAELVVRSYDDLVVKNILLGL